MSGLAPAALPTNFDSGCLCALHVTTTCQYPAKPLTNVGPSQTGCPGRPGIQIEQTAHALYLISDLARAPAAQVPISRGLCRGHQLPGQETAHLKRKELLRGLLRGFYRAFSEFEKVLLGCAGFRLTFQGTALLSCLLITPPLADEKHVPRVELCQGQLTSLGGWSRQLQF